MFELTINGTVYQFNFGIGFVRDITKRIQKPVEGVTGVKEDVGLAFTVAKIIDGDVIAVVDSKKVEADPAKAAKTKVEAVVVEQFKGEKQLIFKFKKRKNYKRTRGHRQNLTRIQIASVGSEKAEVKAAE